MSLIVISYIQGRLLLELDLFIFSMCLRFLLILCQSVLKHCSHAHSCDMLCVGGIPAPVYFGAMIDLTCLKWSIKKCGGRGACRIYDADMYRYILEHII